MIEGQVMYKEIKSGIDLQNVPENYKEFFKRLNASGALGKWIKNRSDGLLKGMNIINTLASDSSIVDLWIYYSFNFTSSPEGYTYWNAMFVEDLVD